MRNRSVMQNQFAEVPRNQTPRSTFSRHCGHKTSFDAGYLIPFYVDECYPGDTHAAQTNVIARLSTPEFPIMDNMFMDIHYFAVPYRLLWENWQKFCGEQDDPGDSTDFLIPTIDWTNDPTPDLYSNAIYMGLPYGVDFDAAEIKISALPFRAINLIYKEWFRDQNMIDSPAINRGDGPDDIDDYPLLKRGKRHDYFTSALPWPQKGEEIDLPLGSTAPVIGNGLALGLTDGTNEFGMRNTVDTAYQFNGSTNLYGADVGDVSSTGVVTDQNKAIGVVEDADYSGLIADLTNATAATINSLREAFQLQKMLEKDARGGTRYTEIIKSHFGVTSPDARMQRPEYLGGGTLMVNVRQVEQTAIALGGGYVGSLGAYGYVSGQDNGFVKSFTEHCVIIGFASVRADLTYQQGVDRMWTRQTRYDHYWPSLAHLGEQEVLRQEIYATAVKADNETVFGYQERFAELRYKRSIVSGVLASTWATPLDAWHLAQEFSSPPTLGQTFIEEDPPIDRCIQVPSEPHFIADFYTRLKSTRPMPTYAVPGLIDHF